MGFIEDIAKNVQKNAPNYGIKVCSPIIAQAILESASGTSELATRANNYFGLKYRPGRCPTASGIYYKVGSEQNADGTYTSSAMQWMCFSSMSDGVQGYFDFINVSNYSNLKGVTDPKTYLENIKNDGYATSLKYVENLLAVIAKYNLTKYDNIVNVENTNVNNNVKYKIAIDAGHGSSTSGKRSPDGFREHWFNTKCAHYLNLALIRCGFDTIKVAWNDTDGTDDTDIPLATRQTQIKNAKCDASISIHANAHGNGTTYTTAEGVETLIHDNTSYVGDSGSLAIKVQNYLVKGTKQQNRGVKKQNLAMCNCKAMGTKASILVEAAFMTNLHEVELLKSDSFCFECAEEIAQGTCEYFGVKYISPSNKVVDNSDKVATTVSPGRTYLMMGDTGKEVKELQQNLNSAGYSCGNADGIFGTKTEVALKNFQKDQKLTVDGKYGSKSKDALSKIVNSKSLEVSSNLDYNLVFNAPYYANKYEDLKRVFGTNTVLLKKHFLEYGMSEGRIGSPNFNPQNYKSRYPDLQKAFGGDWKKYYLHYMQFGRKEGRNGN